MEEKRILVVGASRGLGLGLAQDYARRGWHVVATLRDEGTAKDLLALKDALPDRVQCERVDIADIGQIEALAGRLRGQEFDVVFVNAGQSGPARQAPGQVTIDDVGALFYINAIAPIVVAEATTPLVKEGQGVIAFMSSRVGSVSEPSSGTKPLYRASKAALNSMTRSFVKSIEGRRITVLSLHPGWVRTDMGGAQAPVDVATSVAGLAEVIASRAGTNTHAFLDYRGAELAW